MGCALGSQPAGPPPQNISEPVKVQSKSNQNNLTWSAETAQELQDAVHRIFGTGGKNSLLGLDFSFTIADPYLDGCPLIGCSAGFTNLCGYGLTDIVGKNCRFLVDPVPPGKTDKVMRNHVRDFCKAVSFGQSYTRPANEYESWMPRDRPSDELLALQVNARKDGSLFNNLFYMKVFNIGSDIGDEKPYIVALQSELPGGKNDLSALAANLTLLDDSMAKVRKEMSTAFFVQCAISRQFHGTMANKGDGQASIQLHSSFPTEEVKPWKDGTFKYVRKLADATRNRGLVNLMQNTQTDELVAVKQMPNNWIGKNHDDFIQLHPTETELPWLDIGCTRYLNNLSYKYACNLRGVYRDNEHTFVVSSFVPDGDLFTLAGKGDSLGPQRETALAPVVIQLCAALQLLHGLNIVHRDISLENVLQTVEKDGKLGIVLIDFGMASTNRKFQNCSRGKASYLAPEMRSQDEYDAFLSDAFAAGVTVYSVLLKDYPWLSTEPGHCKCFEYVQKQGIRAYCAKRCVRGSSERLAGVVSEPLMQLLEGMLQIDPAKRLTLGENEYLDRRSVWDEPWMKQKLPK
jgi:serine/threonine protein kinase